MGRRALRRGQEDQKGKIFSFVARVLATFLGGLLLFFVTRRCGSLSPPPPPPTPSPTSMVAGVATTVRTLTPATVPLPTPTLSTPSPEDGDCPDRLNQTPGTPFIYRVHRGHTPSWLSDCFDVSLEDLMGFNWIEDPTKMYEDTYIVVPPAASIGGPPTAQTMLTHQERVAIEAFNAMIADMLVHWPYEPDVWLTDQYGRSEGVQSAALWVQSVLQPYNPTRVLSTTYEWNLAPTVADPDFGWQPWQRGAYGTIRWVIQLQSNEGAHAELTLYQSVHYGLGTLQTSHQVTRFKTFVNRYPGMRAMTNARD